MGLNIGVIVKKFGYTGYGCGQSHPNEDGLSDRFWEHLCERFPESQHTFGAEVDIMKDTYDFDVHFVHYGSDFKGTMSDMYRAIIDFVLDNFGFHEENLEMSLYFNP